MWSAETLAESLSVGLAELGGPGLTEQQQATLLGYLALLQRWNRTYNLTAIKEPGRMITGHLLDSLAILPWVGEGRLLDAGTGAGLPGVPLAVANPRLDVTLLDSAGKKIRFLNHVRRELQLGNMTPVQERLESFMPELGFDVVVSRAFADLASFIRAAVHLLGPTTRLLAMKGRYPDAELRELPDGVRVQSVEELSVPGLQQERHLVIMSVIA
ncbi:MAG: 16S rRNA (guanine(527)-N(7))-methyltransferase RsmG [Xanthomonadales bacterium]|jgi:16S rRNA (guanine527-N7)-methyltransferase|nr:16S rRNA (guanine(527)-N(7))-methyltransferase RsmG [Xanthomonadales bacterium]MDH3923284.1 16S rRNA (guanine(527)-N(7))-methyltransferase RsmG [Xanthomonadales bacterium]MDH3939850.1 16S rRNA (guanine(527)-N(7))-methyltransferase RsmG [Xanthomonadales bacterium]MDH3999773.1 16S rRNA (guanine(527)-N(7))-methyltransferase RsmG [Xanthomonadales bacterium]